MNSDLNKDMKISKEIFESRMNNKLNTDLLSPEVKNLNEKNSQIIANQGSKFPMKIIKTSDNKMKIGRLENQSNNPFSSSEYEFNMSENQQISKINNDIGIQNENEYQLNEEATLLKKRTFDLNKDKNKMKKKHLFSEILSNSKNLDQKNDEYISENSFENFNESQNSRSIEEWTSNKKIHNKKNKKKKSASSLKHSIDSKRNIFKNKNIKLNKFKKQNFSCSKHFLEENSDHEIKSNFKSVNPDANFIVKNEEPKYFLSSMAKYIVDSKSNPSNIYNFWNDSSKIPKHQKLENLNYLQNLNNLNHQSPYNRVTQIVKNTSNPQLVSELYENFPLPNSTLHNINKEHANDDDESIVHFSQYFKKENPEINPEENKSKKRFKNLEILLNKVFLMGNIQNDDLNLDSVEKWIFKKIIDKKKYFLLTDIIWTDKIFFEELKCSTTPKRNEEKLKYIFKMAQKKLKKSFSSKHFNYTSLFLDQKNLLEKLKADKEFAFFHYYFNDFCEENNIDLEKIIKASGGEKFSTSFENSKTSLALKSVNRDYLKIIIENEKFMNPFKEYILFDVKDIIFNDISRFVSNIVADSQKTIKKKIQNKIIEWTSMWYNSEKNVSEFKKIIKSDFEKKKYKLPWTMIDVYSAIDEVKQIIKEEQKDYIPEEFD